MCQKALEILAALEREAKKKNQNEDVKREVKKVFK